MTPARRLMPMPTAGQVIDRRHRRRWRLLRWLHANADGLVFVVGVAFGFVLAGLVLP